MIELQHIHVSFGKQRILNNISCIIEPGDFIIILGTNGAGKTTFFDMLAGKTIPTAGSLLFDGVDITKQSELQRAAFITRLFQNTHLNSVGSYTVIENLALTQYKNRSARLTNGMQSMTRNNAERIVQSLGLPASNLDKPMSALSGGQRQLIAFAMATLHIPKLLLLDEPTAALDPQAATTLLLHASRYIKEHSITTLLITHDPQIALSLGNKIWILENGTISRIFTADQKKNLQANDLIGQINYRKLNS